MIETHADLLHLDLLTILGFVNQLDRRAGLVFLFEGFGNCFDIWKVQNQPIKAQYKLGYNCECDF